MIVTLANSLFAASRKSLMPVLLFVYASYCTPKEPADINSRDHDYRRAAHRKAMVDGTESGSRFLCRHRGNTRCDPGNIVFPQVAGSRYISLLLRRADISNLVCFNISRLVRRADATSDI